MFYVLMLISSSLIFVFYFLKFGLEKLSSHMLPTILIEPVLYASIVNPFLIYVLLIEYISYIVPDG